MVIIVGLRQQHHVPIVVVVRHRGTQAGLVVLAIFHIVHLLIRVIVERKIGRIRWTQTAAVVVRRIDGSAFSRAKTQYRTHGEVFSKCSSTICTRTERVISRISKQIGSFDCKWARASNHTHTYAQTHTHTQCAQHEIWMNDKTQHTRVTNELNFRLNRIGEFTRRVNHVTLNVFGPCVLCVWYCIPSSRLRLFNRHILYTVCVQPPFMQLSEKTMQDLNVLGAIHKYWFSAHSRLHRALRRFILLLNFSISKSHKLCTRLLLASMLRLYVGHHHFSATEWLMWLWLCKNSIFCRRRSKVRDQTIALLYIWFEI